MIKIIIISGPTAVGKTNISIKLAKLLDGEIISADSIQVYKGLDIGSAKISEDEMQGIKHHLIDCINPDENFNVQIFQKMANDAIIDINARGKVPIIVGGTAFYIQALLYGIDFTEEEQHDDEYRNILNNYSEDDLFEKLKIIDPEYALNVHKNNKKRVIRALEYNHFTGRKFSDYNLEQSSKNAIYDFDYFVLDDQREIIYKNIDKRVDLMLKQGVVDEVKALYDAGYKDCNSMTGIGYKEFVGYFDGEYSLEEAIELVKKNSRHFAKRQLTWLRREDKTIFINKSEFDHNDEAIVNHMIDIFSN